MNARTAIFRIMFALILLWAVYLRFWGVWNRGLWMDEAAVANMTIDTPWTGLAHQTELPVAPLFAAVVKITGTLIAPPEIGYRLISILLGIGCIPLSYLVMRAMRIPPAPSLVGMAICASSPWLVIWSRELKQYEAEAFFSLVLALAVSQLLFANRHIRLRSWIALAAGTCALAPWFGYGFVFAAAGLLGAMLLVRPDTCPRRVAVATSLGCMCLMGISTALMFSMGTGAQSQQKELLDYMQTWFIDPMSASSIARAAVHMVSDGTRVLLPYYRWVDERLISTCIGAMIWLMIAFGLWGWPRRTRVFAAIWVFVPWLATAVAASMHRYPFAQERMLVFIALPMCLAFGMGIVTTVRYISDLGLPWRMPTPATVALSLLPVVYLASLPIANSYWVDHDFPTVLAAFQKQRAAGEPALVTVDAAEPARFYMRGSDSELVYEPRSNGTRPLLGYDYPGFARDAVARCGSRFWILSMGVGGQSQRPLFVDEAKRQGYRVELVSESGASNGTGCAQLFLASRN